MKRIFAKLILKFLGWRITGNNIFPKKCVIVVAPHTSNWDFIYGKYKELDFSGITAAFFGCGDQVGYADNFLDAIGLLGKPFMENGGTLIGRWPTEEYDYDNSLAEDGDEFLGLGLDKDNEEE